MQHLTAAIQVEAMQARAQAAEALAKAAAQADRQAVVPVSPKEVCSQPHGALRSTDARVAPHLVLVHHHLQVIPSSTPRPLCAPMLFAHSFTASGFTQLLRPTPEHLQHLQAALGYRFSNVDLLREACIHPSSDGGARCCACRRAPCVTTAHAERPTSRALHSLQPALARARQMQLCLADPLPALLQRRATTTGWRCWATGCWT